MSFVIRRLNNIECSIAFSKIEKENYQDFRSKRLFVNHEENEEKHTRAEALSCGEKPDTKLQRQKVYEL